MHRLTKTSILDSLHSISASAELCCLGATGVNYSLLIRIWLFFFFFFFFLSLLEKRSLCAYYPTSAVLKLFVLKVSLQSSELLTEL